MLLNLIHPESELAIGGHLAQLQNPVKKAALVQVIDRT